MTWLPEYLLSLLASLVYYQFALLKKFLCWAILFFLDTMFPHLETVLSKLPDPPEFTGDAVLFASQVEVWFPVSYCVGLAIAYLAFLLVVMVFKWVLHIAPWVG